MRGPLKRRTAMPNEQTDTLAEDLIIAKKLCAYLGLYSINTKDVAYIRDLLKEPKRRDGHSKIVVEDGELKTVDPHPKPEGQFFIEGGWFDTKTVQRFLLVPPGPSDTWAEPQVAATMLEVINPILDKLMPYQVSKLALTPGEPEPKKHMACCTPERCYCDMH
jgi:hypothetical protein